jgi:hypothetical protein
LENFCIFEPENMIWTHTKEIFLWKTWTKFVPDFLF